MATVDPHLKVVIDRDRANYYKIDVEIIINEEDHELAFHCDSDAETKTLYFDLHHDCDLDGWGELDIVRRALEKVMEGSKAVKFTAEPEGVNEPDTGL